MKKILMAIAVLFSITAISQTVYDANAAERPVSGFNGVIVSNAIDLYISQGTTEAVAVSAREENARDRIKTTVKNGILYISFDRKGWKSWNKNNQRLRAYVTVKNINRLEAHGASDVRISGTLRAENMKLTLSGASDLKGDIKAGNIEVKGSGASDLRLSGSATNASITMSGASDFKGYDFTVDNCKAVISGACDLQITVNKVLDAEASGASSVKYRGNATVKRSSSSGASSIKKKA